MPEVDVGKLEALAGSKYICGETWIKKKKTKMLVRIADVVDHQHSSHLIKG